MLFQVLFPAACINSFQAGSSPESWVLLGSHFTGGQREGQGMEGTRPESPAEGRWGAPHCASSLQARGGSLLF